MAPAEPWEQIGRTFIVTSDSTYTVTVREDTIHGGTYLHCECPSWARSVSKGGCKHVIRVRGGRAMDQGPRKTPVTPVRGACKAGHIPFFAPCPNADCNAAFGTVTDLNIHIERVHSKVTEADVSKVTEADVAAAKRLLAWAGPQ